MATLQLTIEQVNFDASDLPLLDIDDPTATVVDPNTDFYPNISFDDAFASDSHIIPDVNEDSSDSSSVYTDADNSLVTNNPIFYDDISDDSVITPQASLPEVHAKIGKRSSDINKRQPQLERVSYPNLSSKVAQHLYRSNPLILQDMEMALSKSELSMKRNMNSTSNENSPSALMHLANTSEALALQESVIGKRNLQPASPEEVAEVVSKMRDRIPIQNYKNHDNNSVKTNMGDNQSHCLPTGKELHRIPSDQMVTITEKTSWFSRPSSDGSGVNDIANQLALATQRRHMRRGSRKSCSSRCSSLSAQDSSFHSGQASAEVLPIEGLKQNFAPDTELMLEIKNAKDKGRSYSPHSEVDSIYSELDSNYSEQLETQSNFSEMSSISGIEEEMFRIKKLLLEVPALPDNHPDFQKHSVVLGKTAGIIVSGCPEMARAVVDQDVFFELQRQKANLEGQLEYLKSELDEVTNDRSTLQSTVGNLQNQLKTHTIENQLNKTERENFSTRLKSSQDSHRLAEITIAQLRQAVETKSSELNLLNEDLKSVEQSNAKLKLDVEDLKMSVDSKESVNQGLKSKLAEVHVELQMTNQTKIQMENGYDAVKSDIEALLKSKEWYQQQLHATQDSLAKVQQEFVALQGQSVISNRNAEKLLTENAQIRQQLTDTQQRAVKEKEVLMRHLQTIEADMLEREATFEHIERDKGMAEEMLLVRMKKVEEEKSKLTNVVFNLADMEHQLENYKSELELKDTTIAKLDKEFSEVMKQLTILQKTNGEQSLNMSNLENKYIQMEHRYKECQVHVTNREEQISSLKDEKLAIEIALAAANKEKEDVDDALKMVKDNLMRLEQNFKKIKAELSNKSVILEQLQRDNRRLEEQAMIAEQQSTASRVTFETYNKDIQEKNASLSAARQEQQDMQQRFHSMKADLEQYKANLITVTEQRESFKAEHEILQKEKSAIKEELKNLLNDKKQMEEELLGLKSDMDKVMNDDANKKNKRNSLNMQAQENTNLPLQKVIEEKKILKEDLLSLQCSLNGIENVIADGKRRRKSLDLSDGTIILSSVSTDEKQGLNSTDVPKMKEELKRELSEIRQALSDNGNWVETYMEEKRSLELTVEKLVKENSCLKQYIAIQKAANMNDADDESIKEKNVEFIIKQIDVYMQRILEWKNLLNLSQDVSTQTKDSGMDGLIEANTQTDNVSFMKHILQQDEEIRDKSSNEMNHMENIIAKMQQDHKERSRIYESNIKLLTRKLKEAMKAKKKMENDLKALQEKLETEQRIIVAPLVSEPMNNQTAGSSLEARRDFKHEIFRYRGKVKNLQLKLTELEELYKDMKRKAEANETLALSLEREKGRLAGASENNKLLKKHTNQLEVELAQKDATVSALDYTAKGMAQRREEETVQIKQCIQQLEVALAAEQETSKELRKQVFNSKREVSGLKKQIGSLRTGLDNANHLIDVKNETVQKAQAQMEQANELQRKLQLQLDSLQAKYQLLKEQENLKQNLLENETKDAVLAEQIKTLSWHMRAKNQELEALKEHLKFVDNRHANEIQALKNSLQMVTVELETTKEELTKTMEEKFDYQTKLTEIRAALQSSIEQNAALKAQASSPNQENMSTDLILNLNIPEPPRLFNEDLIASLLQKSASTAPSRPLSNLQSCLHTLKQEMEVLHKQINDNS